MVLKVFRQILSSPMLKNVFSSLALVMLGCAPGGAYRYVKWDKPEGLRWLKSADYVLECYRQQTGEEVEDEILRGVTVMSADVTGMVSRYTFSHVFAKDVHDVRYGLVRHIVNMRHSGEDADEFIRSAGLCFGHCKNDSRFEFEEGCVY